MEVSKKKQELRESLLAQRNNISEGIYLKKSSQIISNLRDLPIFNKADVIHTYISLNNRNEVNTQPLVKRMIDSGKEVVVPITQIESGTLRHVGLDSFDNLQENEWGVLEPVDQSNVDISNLELVIVPMVGGDRKKNRIGYGKGFYDRFLADVNCPTVGLIFEQCLIEEVPTESFDVPLDILVTEHGTIS